MGGPGNDIVHEMLVEVADRQGTDIIELPPLGDTIDGDAIQTLLESSDDIRITFEYDGFEITVSHDQVWIHEH